MHEVIEGQWDELIVRQDLHGRRVRVVVLETGKQTEQDPWLRSLRAWADGSKPLGHWVDDSREGIYSGTVDDPR